MFALRKAAVALSLLLSLAAYPLAAQEHQHGPMTPDQLRAMLLSISDHGPAVTGVTPNPNATTKTFTITAKQFTFVVSPLPFTVNQGDTVVLNISVPSNDGSSIGHGFLMDTYFISGVTIGRGQTKQVTFVATTPGMFGYICTQSACGTGHSNMFGQMQVNAVSNPAPSVSSFAPTGGSTAGGTSVAIAGANFVSGATVKFGSVASSSVAFNSSTSLTAVAPAQGAGTVAITVTNPDAQSGSLDGFTYSVPGPSITSVAPSSGPTSGGTSVTISGTGFLSGATVTIGGVQALVVNVTSSSTITLITPLAPPNEQGTLPQDIVITNPDSTTASKAGGFTYSATPLAITTISPAASAPAGGTLVTITGTGFTNAVQSSVTFGGVPATNVQVVNTTTITATAPAHAAGKVDVVVTVGSASKTVTGGFSYGAAPKRTRAVKH